MELPPVDYGRVALQEGVDAYRRGEFAEAYRLLQESPDIDASSVDTRVEALKFSAFSACAQNKRRQCRQAFDKLLVLQPAFELKDAESQHPVWGPIFKQARQQQQQAAARKK
ncbi:TssQ family T6SS-associated lipoprotein [Sphingomonas sp. NCPPB 2930]